MSFWESQSRGVYYDWGDCGQQGGNMSAFRAEYLLGLHNGIIFVRSIGARV